MEYLYILPSLEVLTFNLIILDHCITRKYSILKTIAVICGFTGLLLGLFLLIPENESLGKGQLSLVGFFYIIPLKFLYKEKSELILLNMCMSWTYALGIMAVSIQIAYFLDFSNIALSLVIIETILFLTTFIPFKTYISPQFSYILQNTHTVQNKLYKYLKISIYNNYFIVFILNTIFLNSKSYLLQTIALVIFLISYCIFYHIVYEVIKNSIQVNKLKEEVLNDVLTGLGNRIQVINDISYLIKERQNFSIMFIDLDKFKLINDQYGHDVGDKYLIHFGKVFSDELKDNGKLYRYGGDEFVAIYYGALTQEIVNDLAECKNWDKDAPCQFNQVSIGFITCEVPYSETNPHNLLKYADRIMYANKLKKRQKP